MWAECCDVLGEMVQTREVLEAMLEDVGQSGFKLLRVDGGASRNNLLMQLQADAIQVPPTLGPTQDKDMCF